MRLEKVFINGEVLYREIPEEDTEQKTSGEQRAKKASAREHAREHTHAALARARELGKKIRESADTITRRISEGVLSLLPSEKKGEKSDYRDMMRLLPHLDAEGRHAIYQSLSADRTGLDGLPLGEVLPYLEKEDFEALCRLYRGEKESF